MNTKVRAVPSPSGSKQNVGTHLFALFLVKGEVLRLS